MSGPAHEHETAAPESLARISTPAGTSGAPFAGSISSAPYAASILALQRSAGNRAATTALLALKRSAGGLVDFLAATDDDTRTGVVTSLQRTVGNRAVSRLILARAPPLSPPAAPPSSLIPEGDPHGGMRMDPEVLKRAAQERAKIGVADENFRRNVAVIKFERDGKVGYIAAANVSEALHSEEVLIGKLNDDDPGMTKTKILEVFSEREPCASKCKPLLERQRAKMKYDFPLHHWVPEKGTLGERAELLRGKYRKEGLLTQLTPTKGPVAETKRIKQTVPGPGKPDLTKPASPSAPPAPEPRPEPAPKPAPPQAEAPAPKPPLPGLEREAPPAKHTAPPVKQTLPPAPEAAPTKPRPPIFVPHVEPVVDPSVLRRIFRVLRDIGRELISLKVLVPLQILFEVLNAVDAYSMAMGGMSGRGFIFGKQIAALGRIGRELEGSLAACRRLDDELTQATTLAALGSKEAIDGLREVAPQLAIQVHNRFIEAQERRRTLVQIKQEADKKAAIAWALLESREVPFVTGPAGTMPQAQMLAAHQDMQRIGSLANDALKQLDPMIAVLQQDIEMLAHYWFTAP